MYNTVNISAHSACCESRVPRHVTRERERERMTKRKRKRERERERNRESLSLSLPLSTRQPMPASRPYDSDTGTWVPKNIPWFPNNPHPPPPSLSLGSEEYFMVSHFFFS